MNHSICIFIFSLFFYKGDAGLGGQLGKRGSQGVDVSVWCIHERNETSYLMFEAKQRLDPFRP